MISLYCKERDEWLFISRRREIIEFVVKCKYGKCGVPYEVSDNITVADFLKECENEGFYIYT